jgi:hypothetical protein
MTHPDPQAAPPETDLRALSDEQVVDQFMAAVQDVNAMIEFREQCAADQGSPDKARLFLNAVGNASIAKVEYEQWRAELLRRLARPDALRARALLIFDIEMGEHELYVDGEYWTLDKITPACRMRFVSFSHDPDDGLDRLILQSGLLAFDYPVMGEGDYGYEFKGRVTPEEWDALWMALDQYDPKAAVAAVLEADHAE